jgi:hypothetical protein
MTLSGESDWLTATNTYFGTHLPFLALPDCDVKHTQSWVFVSIKTADYPFEFYAGKWGLAPVCYRGRLLKPPKPVNYGLH